MAAKQNEWLWKALVGLRRVVYWLVQGRLVRRAGPVPMEGRQDLHWPVAPRQAAWRRQTLRRYQDENWRLEHGRHEAGMAPRVRRQLIQIRHGQLLLRKSVVPEPAKLKELLQRKQPNQWQ